MSSKLFDIEQRTSNIAVFRIRIHSSIKDPKRNTIPHSSFILGWIGCCGLWCMGKVRGESSNAMRLPFRFNWVFIIWDYII
jgi:hypothetical protein